MNSTIEVFTKNEDYGAKYFVFSPLVPAKREKNILVLLSNFCSVCIFFEGSVFTFQFLNDKKFTTMSKKNIKQKIDKN